MKKLDMTLLYLVWNSERDKKDFYLVCVKIKNKTQKTVLQIPFKKHFLRLKNQNIITDFELSSLWLKLLLIYFFTLFINF